MLDSSEHCIKNCANLMTIFFQNSERIDYIITAKVLDAKLNRNGLQLTVPESSVMRRNSPKQSIQALNASVESKVKWQQKKLLGQIGNPVTYPQGKVSLWILVGGGDTPPPVLKTLIIWPCQSRREELPRCQKPSHYRIPLSLLILLKLDEIEWDP